MFQKLKTRPWEWMKTHPYCFAMFYFVFYLAVFYTLEATIVPKYLIHCKLDDYIPFCEGFVIFYISWFLLFPGSLIFFLFYDKEDYQNLCFTLMNGATLCFVCYLIWPSGLDLRVEITDGNVFAGLMERIWSVDTPTNVCPSLHVSTSTAAALAVWNSKKLRKHVWPRWAVLVWAVLICLSTVFVKQHSVIDLFCGVLVTALLGVIAYKTDWRRWVGKTVFRFIL